MFVYGSFGVVSSIQAEDTEQFVVKAQLWPYTSLCKFPDSKNSPSSIIYRDATYKTSACSELEKTLGHPSAIRVTIVNLGDSDVEILIEGLNSVILTKKNNMKIPAIAWRWSANHFGPESFVTKVSGETEVIVGPQKSCDLIFLFPAADAGELINIAGLKPVKITE